MRPNPDDLRRHFASLTDDALLDVDRSDLVDTAQQCYDEELRHRRLALPDNSGGGNSASEPDWLKDAACACSFESRPGQDSAPQMDEARRILDEAGIPCYAVTKEETTDAGVPPRVIYELMVPGALNLRALSVLDKELFNPELEAEWIAHFSDLSDEDLQALSVRDLTEGMVDRVQRLTKAYNDECARRGH